MLPVTFLLALIIPASASAHSCGYHISVTGTSCSKVVPLVRDYEISWAGVVGYQAVNKVHVGPWVCVPTDDEPNVDRCRSGHARLVFSYTPKLLKCPVIHQHAEFGFWTHEYQGIEEAGLVVGPFSRLHAACSSVDEVIRTSEEAFKSLNEREKEELGESGSFFIEGETPSATTFPDGWRCTKEGEEWRGAVANQETGAEEKGNWQSGPHPPTQGEETKTSWTCVAPHQKAGVGWVGVGSYET